MQSKPWRGWLVLQPWRHIEAFHELTPEELAGFASASTRMDEAVRVVVRPEKVYVCLFAEAADCQRLPFHIIPRYVETPAQGLDIFQLKPDAKPTASEAEVIEIVRELREFLVAEAC